MENHCTARTRFVEAGGIRFAYRTFGVSSGVPLVFLQHFTGTMDHWDPIITNGIACTRQVILFNNAGVGSSSGVTPDTIANMANDVLMFLEALQIKEADLLGFSLGGFIAQHIAMHHPGLVRKLILVGTGPEGSDGLDELPKTLAITSSKGPMEKMLYLFFTNSYYSKRLGQLFLSRVHSRNEERDPEVSGETIWSQLKAIVCWGRSKGLSFTNLEKVMQPVMIVNGEDDRIVPSCNAHLLYQQLPHAYLCLYPDSAHGALFQYPELFVRQALRFLKYH